MSFVRVKHILMVGLFGLLTACGGSDLDEKSAKTLYQEATQHLYAKDAQFNFKADAAVDVGIENPFLTEMKIKLEGAVDSASKRYELVPEVETPILSFKLPMLVDVKQQEFLVNPSNVIDAALMFAPQANTQLQQFRNKFVRFSPDNFEIDKSDLAEAVSVITEVAALGYLAMDEYTKVVPESSIEKLDLDATAKKHDAKAVLKVKLDKQQSKELQEHINTYLYEKVAENQKLPEEFKQAFMEGLLEASNDSGFESSQSVMYLNDKGQVTHEVSTMNYEVEGDQLSVEMKIDYSNYGNARFSIKPSKSEIVEFTEENVRMLQNM